MFYHPILALTAASLQAGIIYIINMISPILGLVAGISVLVFWYYKIKKERFSANVEEMKAKHLKTKYSSDPKRKSKGL